MSAGLFFSDTPGGLGSARDAGFGASPGRPGSDGVGIATIVQVPNTYQAIVTLTDGRPITLDLPPGPEGAPGAVPTFIAGTVTLVAGANPVLVFRASDQASTYFVDLTMPDPAASVASAAGSASAAAGSASAAAGSASAAAGSASAASTSAGQAAQRVTDAAAQVTLATTQAGNAATSASAAAGSAAAAAASYDSFDDRYLGAKASDPTVDNDGNALLDGALYYKNSGPDKGMKVYDQPGGVWKTGYTALTGGVSSFNGRIGAVVPASGDYTAAQVTGAVAGPAAPTANDIATFNADGSIKDSGVKIGTAASNVLQLDVNGNLPAPAPTVRGGVKSATAAANNFQTGIDTNGAPTFAQPSFSNLSGIATAAQTPLPTTTTRGTVQANTGSAGQFVQGINTSTGALTYAYPLSQVAWSTYTPTMSTASGSGTTFSNVYGRYRQLDAKTILFSVTASISLGGAGTGAGAVVFGLPAAATSATAYSAQIIVGRETVNTGKQLTGSIGSGASVMNVAYYDNTYPGAAGNTLVLTGVYEIN